MLETLEKVRTIGVNGKKPSRVVEKFLEEHSQDCARSALETLIRKYESLLPLPGLKVCVCVCVCVRAIV